MNSTHETKSNDLTPEDLIDAPADIAARAKQEAAWKNTKVNVRQQLHMREAALAHKARVLESIHYYHICSFLLNELNSKTSLFSKLNVDMLTEIVGYQFHGNQSRLLRCIHKRNNTSISKPSLFTSSFRLFLRQRPLLPFEIKNKEYSVVEVARQGRTCLCHKGMLSRTGKRLNISHLEYVFDKVFPGKSSQKEVTDEAVQPLLNHALDPTGGNSTLLLFGQTGTGKTYTLRAALDCVIKRVGDVLDAESTSSTNTNGNTAGNTADNTTGNAAGNTTGNTAGNTAGNTTGTTCSTIQSCFITFFEIHGKKAYDLLSERANVRLMSDANDVVHVRGAKSLEIKSSESLRNILSQGLALRSIQVTERNPISSRSHAICNIKFQSTDGSITLVDLAGSERNYETTKMVDKKLLRESAEINKALGALKNCFRAYHASNASRNKEDDKEDISTNGTNGTKEICQTKRTKIKAPYRHSMLTRVLKRCFEGNGHRTAIIATVSPTTTDLEHTLNTLKHVSLMAAPTTTKTTTTGTVATASPQVVQLRRLHTSGGIATKAQKFKARLRISSQRFAIHSNKSKSTSTKSKSKSKPLHRNHMACVTSDVPLSEAAAKETYYGKLVHLWTSKEVQKWLLTVDNGRFSHVVLPRHVTGEHLMQLGSKKMTDLFTGLVEDGEGRGGGEGGAWTIGVDANNFELVSERRENLGRQLWRAIRKEQQASITSKLGLVA